MHYHWQKITTLSGVLATLAMLLLLLTTSYLQPEYSHQQHLISELNAAGSAYAYELSYFGFLPIGALLLACTLHAAALMRRSWRALVGLFLLGLFAFDCIITAYFPCDAGCPTSGELSRSQNIHNFFGFFSMVLAPIGIALLIGPANRYFGKGKVGRAGAIALPVCIIAFVLLLMQAFPGNEGLIQRIYVAAIYGFYCALSLGLYRHYSEAATES